MKLFIGSSNRNWFFSIYVKMNPLQDNFIHPGTWIHFDTQKWWKNLYKKKISLFKVDARCSKPWQMKVHIKRFFKEGIKEIRKNGWDKIIIYYKQQNMKALIQPTGIGVPQFTEINGIIKVKVKGDAWWSLIRIKIVLLATILIFSE